MKRLIIFDTNALLDIYKFTEPSIEGIIDGFNNLTTYDIFIPKRVVYEFKKNSNKIYQRNPIDCSIKSLTELSNKITTNVRKILIDDSITGNYLDDYSDKVKKIGDVTTSISTLIAELKSKKNSFVKGDIKNSKPYQFVDSEGDNNYFSINELIIMAKEFEDRMKYNVVTPGMIDFKEKKNDPSDPFNKYGDFIIWKELINESSEYDEVYFIEDESKLDWWEDYENQKPKKELINEFNNANKNTKITFISLANFIKGEHDSFPKVISEIESNSKALQDYLDNKEYEKLIDTYILDRLYNYDYDTDLYGEDFPEGSIEEFDFNDIQSIDYDDIQVEEYGYYLEVNVKFTVEVDGVTKCLYYEDICGNYDSTYKISFEAKILLNINYGHKLNCNLESFESMNRICVNLINYENLDEDPYYDYVEESLLNDK